MSNILSYSNKTTKTSVEDWVPVEPYTDDDIRAIRDPNGGLSECPRTAIPSPFAQLDLVKNAFDSLASTRLRSSLMNERLVSDALDVAQIFFNYETHKDYLRIVRWNRNEQLEVLKGAPEHRLYGETLQLFLDSDSVYNFDILTDWYILLWDNVAIGGTSPASLTMAAPGLGNIESIKVEQGVSLFSTIRHLWQRDADFVYYLYLLFNAFPVLRERMGGVYDYMLVCLDQIRQSRTDLYQRIIAALPNPSALVRENALAVKERLECTFNAFSGDHTVNVLGAQFYRKRALNILANVADSDFVIAPSRKQPDGAKLPLVLRGNFNGQIDQYRYVDKIWDSSTEVWAANTPIDERMLPDTAIRYPFITTSDLLCDSIVQLSGELDADHFFDGNLVNTGGLSKKGYLLPLTPTFFKYFNADDLPKRILGRNMFDIEENTDGSVKVSLRIPVKKKFIELTRTYLPISDASWQFDERRGTGRIVAHRVMSAAIFPFVRTNHRDNYTIQQFSQMRDAQCHLRFLANGMNESGISVVEGTRTENSFCQTTYYDVDGSFDFIEATLNCELGIFTGIAVPMWQHYEPSTKKMIFAVDFGTTNSHVEYAERGRDSQPLDFNESTDNTLVATLLKPGALDSAETLQNVEFLPRTIGQLYGFPLRSALSANENSAGNALFRNVNIPFMYERKYFQGYSVHTGLKWNGDTTLSQEFLREIMMLIKAKALLERADLAATEVVYFYPVAMGGADRRRLNDVWTMLYNTYIGGDESNLRVYPESIAPAFYYTGAQVAGSSYVSIDIGGGTSDVVVYQPTPDGMRTEPTIISSFRFAGDAVFGDGFASNDADNNPLLAHYTSYFSKLIEKNADLAYLNSILLDLMKGKRSEDINAFLFSIENVEELSTRREIDRKLFSYNSLLRNDEHRRLVFMYFYAAIIYYIANMMKSRNQIMPKQVYFSGTGSKILNIIGNTSQIEELTRTIIERVWNSTYTERFAVKVEKDQPKQITCRGGVRLENKRLEGQENSEMYSPRNINKLKFCYSMLGSRELTFGDINNTEIRATIVNKVVMFNHFFVSLLTPDVCDEFGIDKKEQEIFAKVMNDDVANYLTAGINSYLCGRYSDTDVVEDVPFFYPVIGIIRHNLLTNLCHEVISKYGIS
ncbi:MAG: hypothetical protein ACI4AH_04885 [Muribaculaceae bacterium]